MLTVRKDRGRSCAFRTGVKDAAAYMCFDRKEICVFLTSIRVSGISARMLPFSFSYRGSAAG